MPYRRCAATKHHAANLLKSSPRRSFGFSKRFCLADNSFPVRKCAIPRTERTRFAVGLVHKPGRPSKPLVINKPIVISEEQLRPVRRSQSVSDLFQGPRQEFTVVPFGRKHLFSDDVAGFKQIHVAWNALMRDCVRPLFQTRATMCHAHLHTMRSTERGVRGGPCGAVFRELA